MKISYAILTHNEGEYIENLLSVLIENKRPEDEIVVVDDFSEDELTKQILEKYKSHINLNYRIFDGDHTQKNYLNSLCSGDFIMQLDADELIYKELIDYLPNLLEENSNIDLFIMPRINTVENLTDHYVKMWGWNINKQGWVNFPDWQMRLYRNCDYVRWDGLLHSKIVGFKEFTYLPTDEVFCILHPKQLDRQIKQNNLYSKIEANGRQKYKT